jgi:hypothetical protein
MLCRNCGAENDAKAHRCVQCGTALEQAADALRREELLRLGLRGPLIEQGMGSTPQADEPVPTYLVQAILVTLFCCLPFGIPAIVFAAMATAHLTSGDRAAAIAAADDAKLWCWISFACGLATVGLYVFLLLLMHH